MTGHHTTIPTGLVSNGAQCPKTGFLSVPEGKGEQRVEKQETQVMRDGRRRMEREREREQMKMCERENRTGKKEQK